MELHPKFPCGHFHTETSNRGGGGAQRLLGLSGIAMVTHLHHPLKGPLAISCGKGPFGAFSETLRPAFSGRGAVLLEETSPTMGTTQGYWLEQGRVG